MLLCWISVGISCPHFAFCADADAISPAYSPEVLARSTDIVPALNRFKEALSVGMPGPYEVNGTKTFRGRLLVTEELILNEGSVLELEGEEADFRTEVQILAPKITIRYEGKAPTIIWKRPQGSPPLPPIVGKAQPGRLGDRPGAKGNPGANGTFGNEGYAGLSGPILYLATKQITGGTLFIDLRGEPGGQGGDGQTGGNGGAGRAGARSRETIDKCTREAGDGGSGGNGGDGGPGGIGGIGGDAGDLVIVSSPQNQKNIFSRRIRPFFSPGKGGVGGQGGLAGDGGAGGVGGDGGQYCKPGKQGSSGLSGSVGPTGQSGPAGAEGRAILVELNDTQLKSLGLE